MEEVKRAEPPVPWFVPALRWGRAAFAGGGVHRRRRDVRELQRPDGQSSSIRCASGIPPCGASRRSGRAPTFALSFIVPLATAHSTSSDGALDRAGSTGRRAAGWLLMRRASSLRARRADGVSRADAARRVVACASDADCRDGRTCRTLGDYVRGRTVCAAPGGGRWQKTAAGNSCRSGTCVRQPRRNSHRFVRRRPRTARIAARAGTAARAWNRSASRGACTCAA